MVGNRTYIKEVVNNTECIVCEGNIPDSIRKNFRIYCGTFCNRRFYKFRRDNDLLKYPLNHYGRFAKVHKKAVKRY